MTVVTQDELYALPGISMSFGHRLFLRCNGTEIPGFVSMRLGEDKLLQMEFEEEPAIGKSGCPVNLELYNSAGLTHSVSGVLESVRCEAAVCVPVRFWAVIEITN